MSERRTTVGLLGCHLLFSSVLGCAGVKPGPAEPGGQGGSAPSTGRGGIGGTVGGAAASAGSLGPPAGSAGTGAGGTGGPPENTCALFDAPVQQLPPDVLIVFDRSGSMAEPVIMGGTDPGTLITCLLTGTCPVAMSKWAVMTGAVSASVMTSDAKVNYGLKFFPSDLGCGAADGVSVPVAPNNYQAVNAAITATAPGGFTPTAAALRSAARYLGTLSDPNPKFVLLATDGEPNCGGGMTANMGGGSDAQAAIDAVKALADAGIPVYVIGIATLGAGDATLGSLATAGGRARAATPPYYPVQTAADLTTALSTIGTQIASCTFSVGQVQPPADPTNVAVKVDGVKIPESDTNGWRWTTPDMTTIEVTGGYCQQLQSGSATKVQAVFACRGFIIN